MSKRKRDPKNPCTSSDGHDKKKWATQKAALFVARLDRRHDGKRRRVYLCPICDKWHVTTNMRWKIEDHRIVPPDTMSA